MRILASAVFTFSALSSLASSSSAFAKGTPVLADLAALQSLGVPLIAKDEVIGVGVARLSEEDQLRLLGANHARGKCAGFEALSEGASILDAREARKELGQLRARVDAESKAASVRRRAILVEKNPEIVAALSELKEDNLRANVAWLSSYPNRDNRSTDPNAHIGDFTRNLSEILKEYPGQSAIDTIGHTKTRQKSVRVRLVGKSRPDEIIVLGGHLDSINQWGGSSKKAPGADDNASGSANLLETLRVLSGHGVPERTVEFFWYAGEESGLLGSAEIAKQYKKEQKNVIAVLQLDMTMFPGAGEFVIASMTDFTSQWLRDYLVAINDVYIHAKITQDRCGYGCSDHASWFRQGYPTLMPFEAGMDTMNNKIHTEGDQIDEQSNFRHSLQFSQIALVFALDLGNSAQQQGY